MKLVLLGGGILAAAVLIFAATIVAVESGARRRRCGGARQARPVTSMDHMDMAAIGGQTVKGRASPAPHRRTRQSSQRHTSRTPPRCPR